MNWTLTTACLLLLILAATAPPALAQPATTAPSPDWDLHSDSWTATDSLNRSLPDFAQAGPPRKDKFVGIFYFLWMTGEKSPLFDITQLLADNPANPRFGPPSAFHWWGKPLFGYYLSRDPAILRKHAQLLADVGVDVLILDVTNAVTYDTALLALCRVLTDLRQTGQRTPQIAFITHSHYAKTVQHLWDHFYSRNLYPDLWFRWKGKPLLLSESKDLSPEIRSFFTFRESWAWTTHQKWFADGKDKWPWLDHHPQTPGWHDNPAKPEAISVCVAEHPVSNIGRSFHAGQQPPPAQRDPALGLCFDEQWRRALAVDPEFIFITGWNEWIAQRFINTPGGQPFLGKRLPPNGTFFVDQYNQEFSRDIEPMTAGHTDNYYYQLTGYIRRFKGVRPPPTVVNRPIRLGAGFEQWRDVQPEFRDTLGDPVHRDHPGWGGQHYTNTTGRNDIIAAKVAWDDRNLYFYVRTKDPITPPTTPNWMLLFLRTTSATTQSAWQGYNFIVNRTTITDRTTTLERNQANQYTWTSPTPLDYHQANCELELAIPLTALGLTTLPATLDFKWADNCIQSPTPSPADFTQNGDSAPNDRFNYHLQLTP